ncbi:MAG: molybdopterin-binding protein [Rhodobacteraceae bacterium]|nr:molybdopterin-binding protein [Paracoccaceae bacterium]
MIFARVPPGEALGAVLAHSVVAGKRRIAKGSVLGPEEVAALIGAGRDTISIARLEPGDVGEEAAAARLAAAMVPDPAGAGLRVTAPHAGRVNLHATRPGLAEFEPSRIHALNRVDPAMTVAVLAPLTRVTKGQMVATIKIIPYAVADETLRRAEALARAVLRVRPVERRSAGLVLTEAAGETGGRNAALAEKARLAVAGRLAALGIDLAGTRAVAHERAALAEALVSVPGEMVLILTAAATADLHDTAPEAVHLAGGSVQRFGMPVDPGNLLFFGELPGRPVIGLPGCARSPALNGADWVLERIACGLVPSDDEIAMMGVGGLLKEIPTRPQPRDRVARRGPG